MAWIEIKISIPKVCEKVLICTDKGNVSSGHLSKRYENLWTIDDQEFSNEIVIAWQPLPSPLKYSKGIECGTAERTYSHQEDFSEDEKYIGDAAFIECQDRIKKVIIEYLSKDEILTEVFSGISSGVQSFCEEYYNDIIKQIVISLSKRSGLDLNLIINKHQ